MLVSFIYCTRRVDGLFQVGPSFRRGYTRRLFYLNTLVVVMSYLAVGTHHDAVVRRAGMILMLTPISDVTDANLSWACSPTYAVPF